MKSLKKYPIRFRPGNGRRGTVIVLVVAVLALLAVIGTVYIVSARTERAAAQAGAVAANLDLAQRAVNDAAVQAIGEAMFDAKGILGGMNGGAVGPFGSSVARTYDMADFNRNLADRVAGIRDQSWLVTNLYRPGYEAYSPFFASSRFNDMTMPQTVVGYAGGFSPSVFNPSTGGYTLPVYVDFSGSWTYPFPYTDLGPGQGVFRVVPDPSVGPPTIPYPDDYAGHPSTGPSGPDALVQLLPFSEASGVRYRFGIRIIDTSRMANLNVGMTYPWTAIALNGTEYNGTFVNGYNLANPDIFNGVNAPFFATMDEMEKIGGSNGPTPAPWNPARAGGFKNGNVFGDSLIWSEAILRLDMPQLASLAPFDLSDELGLRSYGTLGTMSVPRFASSSMWPNTLGNRFVGSANSPQYNPRRGVYTSYSYSRELRPASELDPTDPNPPYGSLAYILQTSGGVVLGIPPVSGVTGVWPAFPARVGVGVDVTASSGMTDVNAAHILAATATNIATAMNRMPTVAAPRYSRDEAVAFAANYLTYRWADWLSDVPCTVGGTTFNAWYLVNGPSFIDTQGICIRNAAGGQEYGTLAALNDDLDSGVANQTVVGFAAQPFINEVLITQTNVAGVTSTTDFAVELYNPYNVPLSLDGYKIMVDGASYVLSPLLSADPDHKCIPARGYFVFAKKGGALAASVAEDPKVADGGLGAIALKDNDASFTTIDAATSKKIYLMRPYIPRLATTLSAWAAVDQFDLTGFSGVLPPTPGNSITYTLPRQNDDATVLDPNLLTRWKATVALATGTAPAPGGTLGKVNPTGTTVGVPLYSRAAVVSRLPFANIADFNNIMRIGNQIDTTTGLPMGKTTIPDQLIAIVASPNPEGNIHFDFVDPLARNTLDCLAMVDRVSDYTINLGDNDPTHRGLSKIRIPGQINVNTAPPEVLATIPFLKANPQYISRILAYRWRTRNDDPTIDNRFPGGFVGGLQAGDTIPPPVGGTVPVFNYSATPGYGISSMFELKALLNPATSTTLADRDMNWARVYNYLTTRSDTFVVYAYLEAVRVNPRYSGPFTNGLEWYTTSNAPGIGISDDPNDTQHALQRVSRRRWVAIVDRSNANYSRYTPEYMNLTPPQFTRDNRFVLPRVVAQKDLPR